MRISDWSSDVCSSDLGEDARGAGSHRRLGHDELVVADRHRLGARDPAESRDGGDHNDKDDGSEARADDGDGGKAEDEDGKGAGRKGAGEGKGVARRVVYGGWRCIKKKQLKNKQ